MKERPIIFTGESVRAILEGRKTQTRLVIKPQPKIVHEIYPDSSIETEKLFRSGDQRIHCPYPVGQRLWVKETWGIIRQRKPHPIEHIFYRASSPDALSKWKSSIFMPRDLSRITLEVTEVRAQRVQNISEEDARAEGIERRTEYSVMRDTDIEEFSGNGVWTIYPQMAFKFLWDSINAKRGYSWEINPWIWAISFRKIRHS